MLFTTPTQFAALALVLIAGWLFGLASAPGGKKWKQRYRDEERARIELDREVRELRLENERLRKNEAVADAAIHEDRRERRGSVLPTLGGAAATSTLAGHTAREREADARTERDRLADPARTPIAPQSAARPAHDSAAQGNSINRPDPTRR